MEEKLRKATGDIIKIFRIEAKDTEEKEEGKVKKDHPGVRVAQKERTPGADRRFVRDRESGRRRGHHDGDSFRGSEESYPGRKRGKWPQRQTGM